MNFLKRILSLIKRHKRITSVGIVILVALIFIFRPQPLKPIETQKVTRGTFTNSISITGTINSATTVDLTFPIAGKLTFLGVKKGDSIKAFQTIATLDVRTVQKNLESDLIDYSLQRNTFDQTQDNYQNRTPEQSLNDAMKRILQNNQYNLDKAVNSVELQALAKEQSFLVSPISGIITRADPQTSNINITSSATFTVADPENLVFQMDIDEADVGRIKEGQDVDINLDAYPDKTIRTNVNHIDFASHTNSTGSNVFTVKTNLSQRNNNYKIGMNGDAQIVIYRKNNSVIISSSSIINDNYMFVKTGNIFEKRKITIGQQNDTQSEVLRGLTKGEEIATTPLLVPQKKSSIPLIGRFLEK